MTGPMIGIQVGAASFIDEGLIPVLDTVEECAGVNTLFLATTTWSRVTGGRAEVNYPYPGHGSREQDLGWVGGHYATIHPEYYGGTLLGPIGRAPEHPGWDMLENVLPEAQRRGLRSIALIDESSHSKQLRSYPNFLKCLEVDIWNKPARRPCFNNPDYRNWHLGLVEDMIKSYDLDGLLWSSERPSPMDRLIQEPTSQGLGLVVCYCEHCKRRGAERGVDWRRAQEGYRKLVGWNAEVSKSNLPNDGAFVAFWRLLLNYPELLAWQSLWIDGQHQMYRDIFGTVRAYRPEMKVGWSINQSVTFSPFQRAAQNYADLSHFSDFLKIATFDTSGGPRFQTWITNLCRALFGDAEPEQVYPLIQKILGIEEPDFANLHRTGLSADYVRREVQRTVVGVEGRCVVYAGIDVGVPVGQPSTKVGAVPALGDVAGINHDSSIGPGLIACSPERVRCATRAAFAGGAAGVILGEKYSQMRIENLAGLRGALVAPI